MTTLVRIARLASKSSTVTSSPVLAWPDLAAELTAHSEGPKDGPAWMPADIDPGARNGERVRAVTALVLDVEAAAKMDGGVKRLVGPLPPALVNMAGEVALCGWAAVLATSHSHMEPTNDGGTLGPRYRVAVQLSRPLRPGEVKPLAMHVARLLGVADSVDTGCMEPVRLFYLPRCPADWRHLAESRIVEGRPLPVDELLSAAVALSAPGQAHRGQSGSVIEAFNAQADIPTLLDRHGYKPAGGLRWLWPGSTTGVPGVVLYPDKGRVFSGHTGDPLHAPGRAHDAFSAWAALEHGGDTMRAVRAAASLLGMERQMEVAAQAPGAAPVDRTAPVWSLVPVHDLDTAVIPAQSWAWKGYVPARQVTLLAADGGTGKSMIALMLAVCTAVGLPLFGVETTAAPVVFFSAEDDCDTVRRRLAHICRALGVPAELLHGHLLVLDASSVGAELVGLVMADGVPKMGATKMGADLADFVRDLPAPLLIVDNASDTFGGNEIDRREVRGFIRWLARIVRSHEGAVVLLAHVNANTARGFGGSGSAYSGSTAWNNSVRSRLYLSRDKSDGALTLEHQKSNYGPMREPLRLIWPRDGLPELELSQVGMAGRIASNQNTVALLRLVADCNERGERVSTATSGAACLTVVHRSSPHYPTRAKNADVWEALRVAERCGWIERESYRDANRKQHERYRVTPEGRDVAGLAPIAPIAPIPGISAEAEPAQAPAPIAPIPARGVWGDGARAQTEAGTGARAPFDPADLPPELVA